MTTATVAPPWRRAAVATLPLWIGTRVAIVLLTVGAGWLLPAGDRGGHPRFLDQWHHWDTDQFRKVAQFGYFSPAYQDRTEAFFPGMPLAMRLVHPFTGNWITAGLVVSVLAGAVTCLALWRLAALEGGAQAGTRAVQYLVVFPYAVFLFAGYSEALFLAFATTAWLAARRGDWWVAGLLAAGASTTRITGVALGAGLAVEYVTRRHRDGGWSAVFRPEALALGLPALPVLGYFTYLHHRTGHWDAYSRALAEGWGRHTVSPVTAFRTTWDLARNTQQSRPFLWSYRAEIVAMALGLLLTVALLCARRWGEATFVGVNLLLLSTSTYYASCVRALMVWFPAYLLLARLTARRQWLHKTLLVVSAPLAVLVVLAFTEGTWLG